MELVRGSLIEEAQPKKGSCEQKVELFIYREREIKRKENKTEYM